MPIRVECHTDETAFEPLHAEWEALARATPPQLPYRLPTWSRLWWKHYRANHPMVKDHLRLFTVREDGRLIGVAPMMLTERPSVGPLRVRFLQFLGTDPYVTEVRGPVCHVDRRAEVMEALVEKAHERGEEWDALRMAGLLDGPALEALSRQPSVARGKEIPSFVLSLPESFDTFKSGLSRNTKEAIRKCYNSLKRENLEFQLKVRRTSDEVPEAIERFFRLHAERSGHQGGVFHPNIFGTPLSQAFLRETALELSKSDVTRVFEIEIGGEVRASRVAFEVGPVLYLYFSGFQPAWGKYSVMTTCNLEAFRWAIEKGLKEVNLSTGEDPGKLRWNPTRLTFHEATVPGRSLRSRVVLPIWERAYGLKHDKRVLESPVGLLLRQALRKG